MHDRGPGEGVLTIGALRLETTTWDPGGNKGTSRSQGITIANIGTEENDAIYTDSRTELDSHANMAVIGWHAHILSTSDRTVEVNAFTQSMQQSKHHSLMQHCNMTPPMMGSHIF